MAGHEKVNEAGENPPRKGRPSVSGMESKRTHLDVFLDSAVYTLNTDAQNTFLLPEGVQEVTALTRLPGGKIQNIRCARIFSGSFDRKQKVEVDGRHGYIHELGPNFIDLADKGEIVRIYKPKQITSRQGRGVGYLVEGVEGPVSLSGVLPAVSWQPLYQVILGPHPDSIRQLALLAQFSNGKGGDIAVESATFRTLASARNSSREPRLAAQSLRGTAEVSESGPTAEFQVKLPSGILYETDSVPLANFQDIAAPRKYFLRLQESDLIMYGYILETGNRLPSGPARIHHSGMNLAGQGLVEVVGKSLYLLVAAEEKLVAETRVHRGTADGTPESAQIISFTAKVNSAFPSMIALRVELPFSGLPAAVVPEQYQTEPGKLFWEFQIRPGEQKLLGRVVFS